VAVGAMLSRIISDMGFATEGFIIAITLSAIVFHIKYSQSIAHKAPAFLTTLGILGTFSGMAMGLLDFNTNDVQGSVPALIGGLKTAFWASAWGIICALTIIGRDIASNDKKKIDRHESRGATIDDLATLLSELQQSIAGSSDTTLLSQLKIARIDSNERLDKLVRAINELSKQLADKPKPSGDAPEGRSW